MPFEKLPKSAVYHMTASEARRPPAPGETDFQGVIHPPFHPDTPEMSARALDDLIGRQKNTQHGLFPNVADYPGQLTPHQDTRRWPYGAPRDLRTYPGYNRYLDWMEDRPDL